MQAPPDHVVLAPGAVKEPGEVMKAAAHQFAHLAGQTIPSRRVDRADANDLDRVRLPKRTRVLDGVKNEIVCLEGVVVEAKRVLEARLEIVHARHFPRREVRP